MSGMEQWLIVTKGVPSFRTKSMCFFKKKSLRRNKRIHGYTKTMPTKKETPTTGNGHKGIYSFANF